MAGSTIPPTMHPDGAAASPVRPLVTIIVLTYNSSRYVEPCLRSVMALPARPSHEVIVVDNASTDDTVARLAPWRDRLHLVQNGRNLLSTKGLNPGIRASRGAIVVLLDVDTEVSPAWLAELCRPIQDDPTVAITGSKLLYPDGKIQHAGGGTWGNGHARHDGSGQHDGGQWDQPRDVEYVTGAATAIRRSFLEQVGGGLDELFPFYYEDVDLCEQARALGYRVHYVPASVAIHHESVGMRVGTLRYMFNMHRGRWRHLLKNRPGRDLLGRAVLRELVWIARDQRSPRQLAALLAAYAATIPALPEIVRGRKLRHARANRGGPMRACIMGSSLFLRANGSLSCWCDHGKDVQLGLLTVDTLAATSGSVLDRPELRAIRRAFRDERIPHPGTCEGCVMLGNQLTTDRSEECRFVTMLHVEPSILCRLRCQDCIQELDGPTKNLPLPLYAALLANLREQGIEDVRIIHFEGLGEPTMNPALPEMIDRARDQFPRARLMLTSNGDAPWSAELGRTRLDHLRVSIDGVDQESYERYRRGGSFERAIAFLRGAARNRERTGFPREVDWKYVLFEWNDSDAHIEKAARLAAEIGVRCTFDMSFAPGDVTKRFDPDTLEAHLAAIAPGAVSIARARRGSARAPVAP